MSGTTYAVHRGQIAESAWTTRVTRARAIRILVPSTEYQDLGT